MEKKKRKKVATRLETDTNIDRWMGTVDEHLRQNDLRTDTLVSTLKQQHEETLSSIKSVCGMMVPLQEKLDAHVKESEGNRNQISVNTQRLNDIESEIYGKPGDESGGGLKNAITVLKTKAIGIVAGISLGMSLIFYLGRLLITHITGK
jgi:hypothetical protein